MIYDAVVENINDPMKLGRVQVRVFGLNTDNTALIPTEDLTWARVLMSNSSASMSGIGLSPSGLLPGAWVMVAYQDAEEQYPIVIGSYHGIPSSASTTTKANDDLAFASVEVHKDAQANQGTYTPPDSDLVLPTSDSTDLSSMPIVPPKGTPNYDAATKNIGIIIASCKSAGITTRKAIASILGVIGGECMWIPTKGNYNYSSNRLTEVFPSVFPTIESAKPYANNPVALPEKLYGVGTKKGSVLGNTQVGDASRYIDRGFLQLLGRYNYNKYGNLASVDIISNPDLMISNPVISAKVCIAYVLDRVKVSQSSDGYFDAVKNAVGNNTPDIAIKKRKFYEYFMSGADNSTNNEKEIDQTPPEKFDIAAANDPSIYSAKAGFSDPDGKYPLYINEQDTSRLARRERLDKTIVQKKNDNRVKGIESFNTKWDEQISPYNTTYPFNQVRESVAGHVIEIDDTPNSERLHIYHKSGSYVEIDNTGSRTTRIVGSSYEIIDYNGHIYIGGSCNITIGGHANVTIGGDVNANIGGSVKANVSGDVDLSVAGDIAAYAKNINLEAMEQISLKAGLAVSMDAAMINMNSGASVPSGLSAPTTSSSPSIKSNPVPTKASDSKAVLFEADGDSFSGDNFIKESVANGEISADAATKKPVEGDSSNVSGKNKDLIPSSCAQIASMDRYPDNLRLSPNFTLGQVSSHAAVSSASVRDQNGLTSAEIVCNLQNVCLNVLEFVIKKYPNVFVTSGFRYPSSNARSQHPNGEAVDLQFKNVSKAEYYKIALDLAQSIPNFDQFLLEYAVTTNNPWIHISCTRKSNRRQIMTFYNHKKYKDGLVDLS
jgi:predicted chitinase